jgi:hypothetical protein
MVWGKNISILFQKFPKLRQHNRRADRTNAKSKKSQSHVFSSKNGNKSIMLTTRKINFFSKVSGANPKKDIFKNVHFRKTGYFWMQILRPD